MLPYPFRLLSPELPFTAELTITLLLLIDIDVIIPFGYNAFPIAHTNSVATSAASAVLMRCIGGAHEQGRVQKPGFPHCAHTLRGNCRVGHCFQRKFHRGVECRIRLPHRRFRMALPLGDARVRDLCTRYCVLALGENQARTR